MQKIKTILPFFKQPWTLDSTISEENRAVIEKMLLEEEYPLMIMRKVKISGLKIYTCAKFTHETIVSYQTDFIWPPTASI